MTTTKLSSAVEWLLIAAIVALVFGIVLSEFGPDHSQQRVIWEGTRWKLVEDYSTHQTCLFDKTEVLPPTCKPLRERGSNPFDPSMFPGEDSGSLPPPVPETLPDEP